MNIRNRIQYLYMTGAVTPTIKLTSNQMLKSYQFRVTYEVIFDLYILVLKERVYVIIRGIYLTFFER